MLFQIIKVEAMAVEMKRQNSQLEGIQAWQTYW